jgi:hypothetical protein
MSAAEVCQIVLDKIENVDLPHVRNRIYKEEEMSGCHTPESKRWNIKIAGDESIDSSFALCKHMAPVKLGCPLCDEEVKQKASHKWELMCETCDYLSRRILDLEVRVQRQLNINIDNLRRIETLEKLTIYKT